MPTKPFVTKTLFFTKRDGVWFLHQEEATQNAVAQRLRDEVSLRRKQEELAVAKQVRNLPARPYYCTKRTRK
jgi:hypothetical protein